MLIRAHGTLRNGHDVDYSVRVSNACTRSGHGWLINHEHVSLPADVARGHSCHGPSTVGTDSRLARVRLSARHPELIKPRPVGDFACRESAGHPTSASLRSTMSQRQCVSGGGIKAQQASVAVRPTRRMWMPRAAPLVNHPLLGSGRCQARAPDRGRSS
jgi:hypothetical protein